MKILSYFLEWNKLKSCRKRTSCSFPSLVQEYLVGFFDGAVMKGFCGSRIIIKVGNVMVIKGSRKAGVGTNTRVEVVGLWTLLFCAKTWGIKHLQVLGDSQVIIKWALGEAHVKSLELQHCLSNTMSVMKDFTFLSFKHIYREMNVEVDSLSKRELSVMDGRLSFPLFSVGICIRTRHFDLFKQSFRPSHFFYLKRLKY